MTDTKPLTSKNVETIKEHLELYHFSVPERLELIKDKILDQKLTNYGHFHDLVKEVSSYLILRSRRRTLQYANDRRNFYEQLTPHEIPFPINKNYKLIKDYTSMELEQIKEKDLPELIDLQYDDECGCVKEVHLPRFPYAYAPLLQNSMYVMTNLPHSEGERFYNKKIVDDIMDDYEYSRVGDKIKITGTWMEVYKDKNDRNRPIVREVKKEKNQEALRNIDDIRNKEIEYQIIEDRIYNKVKEYWDHKQRREEIVSSLKKYLRENKNSYRKAIKILEVNYPNYKNYIEINGRFKKTINKLYL